MIDAIIAVSIRHRALVVLCALALAVLGGWAVWTAPIDAVPDLSENQAIVFTEWKGHGPRAIEDQVTYPLALALRGLRGARTVRTSSDVGFSTISVIFEDGRPIAEARREVAERIERARGRLPAGAVPELAADAAATGQIFWYTVEGGGLDPGRLRAVQDWYLRPQLGSVPGVAEVASVGGFPIEYEVAVDPDRLRLFGLSASDVVRAASASNAMVGGQVINKGNAEYVVRGVGRLGASLSPGDESFDSRRALRDLENVVLRAPDESAVRLVDVATIAMVPGFRRGALEKDGSEAVGGAVLMARGENPLEVIQRVKAKLDELRSGLPAGVRVVPFYDRTPLIEGAVATVSGTVIEAMVSAVVCVLLVLAHARASLAVVGALPLAALASFLVMAVLRRWDIVDVPCNAMSLAGIAISIGVLVDSSVVMAENVMHRLGEKFGREPVRGDVRDEVRAACQAVGRPIVFSVAIMVLSFLPVFALEGAEGKMFRPMAYTKTFALASVAALAVTLTPALCSIFIRGRLRSERENPLVRSVIEVYRPVLSYLLDRPAVLAVVLGLTFLLGFAPLGNRPLFLGTLVVAMTCASAFAATRPGALAGPAVLVAAALAIAAWIAPIEHEFLTPLNEGMVMDMPITVPRASVAESVDDMSARNMVLCRFPEVDMVVGKAGRADSPLDPAPMDMIETMVNFRPREFWPRRKMALAQAAARTKQALEALLAHRIAAPPRAEAERSELIDATTASALARFDALARELAYHRNQELTRELQGAAPTSARPWRPEEARLAARWARHVRELDDELLERAAPTYARLAIEELLDRLEIRDPAVAAHRAAVAQARAASVASALAAMARRPRPGASASGGHHHQGPGPSAAPTLEPCPALDEIERALVRDFQRGLVLWRVDPDELTGPGGELDAAVRMPGWTNVWTMPIQNRVDMVSTGVNTPIGVRVLGADLDDVVRASEDVARAIKTVRGAVDVIADPIRGKPYIEARLDHERAARLGVPAGAVAETLEIALAGKTAATIVDGRERHPVVVRYPRALREDEESIGALMVEALVASKGPQPSGAVAVTVGDSPTPSGRFAESAGPASSQAPLPAPTRVPLSEVARVHVVEGPATIKGENGLLRNYVRLNVRGRDPAELVEEARAVVARDVALPPGVHLEWTGQFEHAARARRALAVVVPIVAALIFLVLYWTYRDLADAALMMLAVPGAIAGGLFFQWSLGVKLSVTVWIGYIACFGMATSTGIIMLVYLREALDRAGGLEHINLGQLRQAVLDGAVHRLRPKLLTEGTVVAGLAPMLWSHGVASEIIQPMAAPVLGGILVADEVIDLFLPVMFYWVRRRRWRRLHSDGDVDDANLPSISG